MIRAVAQTLTSVGKPLLSNAWLPPRRVVRISRAAWLVWLLSVLAVEILLAVTPGDAAGTELELEVGRLRGTPELDARLDRSEGWLDAARLPFQTVGQGEVRLAWHGRWLYLGLRLPVPSVGLLRRAQARVEGDALSLLDDSVDVWLSGFSVSAPLTRVIVNANDAIWDAEYSPSGDGAPEIEWGSGAQSASRVGRGVWSAELRIPLPEGAVRDGMRMRWVHHARRPDRDTSWPSPAALKDPSAGMARLSLVDSPDPPPATTPPAVPLAERGRCAVAWTAAVQAAEFHVAWLPYTSKLRLELDLSGVPGAAALPLALVSVRREGEEEPVWNAQLGLSDHRADVVQDLPELTDGVYEVAADFSPGLGCEPVAGPRRRFEQRRFGWEHNGLGESDDVIPPFTALEVSGSRVRAVLREYELNDQGLPQQIRSRGVDLLGAPAHFQIRAGGRVHEPSPVHPVRIVRESPGRVRSEAAWSAGGLRVRTLGSIEMDGMWRVDLVLSGSGARLEQLDLVIPLRAERMSLINAVTDGARHHRLGALTAGEGVVWSSHGAGREALSPDFVPYLWVGDEERGLSWFAESQSGWQLAPGRPAQELVRRGDILELVVHFAAGQPVLNGTRRVTFGLQATPTKPRPEHPRNWRAWQLACHASFSAFRLCPWGSGGYWGAETRFGSLHPRDHDYSLLRYLGRVRDGEKPDNSAIDAWLDARGLDADARERSLGGLRYALDAAAARPDAIALYVNVHGTAWTPEFAVYQDEWRAEPFGDRAGRDADELGEIKIRSSESWNDYVLWHLDRLLETGATDGFFLDNTYLKADFNEVEGSAYRDDRGVLHPGVDLFALRELMKRAQILTYKRRGAWLNISHMTTTPVAPVQTWAGVSLGGEWRYGTQDYQERFPRDLLRAASLGAQVGTVSAYLPGLTGNPSPSDRQRLERGLAGLTAVHEIRVHDRIDGPLEVIWRALTEFGYGRRDAVVERYWDADRGFTLAGVDAEALVVARNGRALALLVSFGAAGDVDLRFDPASASFSSLPHAGSCRDLEGQEPPPTGVASGCRLHLERHDFRLVAYERSDRRR